MPLTPTELDMLAFERENTVWQFEGRREQAIWDRFAVDRDTYALRLVRLLRKPEALEHDPLTVRRLQARIDANRVRSVDSGGARE